MSETNEIYQLFPTNVWEIQFSKEQHESLNNDLVASINELLEPRAPIPPGQTRQTRNDIHTLPQFFEFAKIIKNAGAGVLEFLQIEQDKFDITGCWANVNPPGSSHSPHTHPNNYLSGVYFVRAPQGANQICFFEPRPFMQIITPKFKVQNEQNANMISLNAQEGGLLIFPASLKHAVPPNQSQEERISISFNLMFSDFSETMSQPLWEGIS